MYDDIVREYKTTQTGRLFNIDISSIFLAFFSKHALFWPKKTCTYKIIQMLLLKVHKFSSLVHCNKISFSLQLLKIALKAIGNLHGL